MRTTLTSEKVNEFIKSEKLEVEEVKSGDDPLNVLFEIIVELNKKNTVGERK